MLVSLESTNKYLFSQMHLAVRPVSVGNILRCTLDVRALLELNKMSNFSMNSKLN